MDEGSWDESDCGWAVVGVMIDGRLLGTRLMIGRAEELPVESLIALTTATADWERGEMEIGGGGWRGEEDDGMVGVFVDIVGEGLERFVTDIGEDGERWWPCWA